MICANSSKLATRRQSYLSYARQAVITAPTSRHILILMKYHGNMRSFRYIYGVLLIRCNNYLYNLKE